MKSREEIISGNYNYFLESGAPYVTARAAEPEYIDCFDRNVPNLLRELWRTHGFGTCYRGLIQFCDPKEFAPNVEEVFGDDPDFKPSESAAFAHTAFGTVFVWNARWGLVRIDLPRQRVVPYHGDGPPEDIDWDRQMSSGLASIGPSTVAPFPDERDGKGQLLFDRAVQTLGPLQFGEVYGLFPALGLGGAYNLKSLRRVRAPEHFSMLAQIGPFELIDATTFPSRAVRLIG